MADEKETQGHQNLTPDVAAALLGNVAGIFLGGALTAIMLLTTFVPGIALMLFGLVLTAGIATWFAYLCDHMELTGHRLFRQANYLITSSIVLFFVITLTAITMLATVTAKLTQMTANIPEALLQSSGAGGLTTMLPNTLISPSQLGMWAAVYAFAIIIPFAIRAKKQGSLRATWFLPLLVPLFLCLAAAYITPFIVNNIAGI